MFVIHNENAHGGLTPEQQLQQKLQKLKLKQEEELRKQEEELTLFSSSIFFLSE